MTKNTPASIDEEGADKKYHLLKLSFIIYIIFAHAKFEFCIIF